MFKNRPAFGSFAVKDVPKAKEFYTETLGLNLTGDNDGFFSLDLPGEAQIFVYQKEDHQPAVFTVLNFQVDDIDSAVDQLTDKGIKFEQYEEFDQDEKGIARGEEGPTIAWFKDPSGNILAVMEGM